MIFSKKPASLFLLVWALSVNAYAETTKHKVLTLVSAPKVSSSKDLMAENEKLKGEIERRNVELKAVQAALVSANSRAKTAESERLTLEAQLKALKGGGETRWVERAEADISDMISLVDASGQAVWLNGVGETQIATTGELTVMKFPVSEAPRTDRALGDRGASRSIRGRFIYYTIPSGLLVN